ncbi:MAG: hypothetical protein U5K81_06120 [Trueperaceae bacterium]|nr:hypothetical protein [Trueperaceae bacterium]
MDGPPEDAAAFLIGRAGPPAVAGEPAELAALAAGGLPLAPILWVPAAAEATFYRLNGLPHRLEALFETLDPVDPDEDDVEELAPRARALLREHVVLDTWIDAFYDRLERFPSPVRVRRPGTAGRVEPRGRPALLALRATWADAWSDDRVLARARATGSVHATPAPVLVQAADDAPASPDVSARAEAILGERREVRVLAGGGITRVARVDGHVTPHAPDLPA